jgi:hypothetical protein
MARMSDKNKPACIFCDQTAARSSAEHVLPHHWKKTFPSGAEGHTRMNTDWDGFTGQKEKKQVTPYDLKVSRVCTDCNSGWMREMDEAIKLTVFDLAWGNAQLIPADKVNQLATWCTKVALMRTHRDRNGEQEGPLSLTHRFFRERSPLGEKTVQVGKVADSESSLTGNIARQLRTLGELNVLSGEQIDSVNLVSFQIGQFFFQVGLSTGTEWSARENSRLLAAGRRNRTSRIHVIQPDREVLLQNILTQADIIDLISTCRMVSQASAIRDNNIFQSLVRARSKSS